MVGLIRAQVSQVRKRFGLTQMTQSGHCRYCNPAAQRPPGAHVCYRLGGSVGGGHVVRCAGHLMDIIRPRRLPLPPRGGLRSYPQRREPSRSDGEWMVVKSSMTARCRFQLVLIKPSHYDDDGYVIRWWRAMIPSNSL